MPYKNILVCVDFSDISDAVVNTASFFASLFNSRINLLSVVENPMPFVHSIEEDIIQSEELQVVLELEKKLYDEAKEKLSIYKTKLENLNLNVNIYVEIGEVVDTILDFIDTKDIDLVILGSHQKGLIDKLLLGSVSEKIINKSPVSTLVVKGHDLGKIEKIVVGYDFLPNSKEALQIAEEIALTTNSELFIVHADTDIKFAHIKTVYKVVEEKKKELLRDIVSQLNQKGISSFFEILKEPPVDAILDELKKYNPDLVVIGKRKSSRLKRLFIGTTAQKVVENSNSPVLIVRHKGDE